MQTLNLPKVDGVSVEPAIEYNSLGYELQNLVTSTGQTLDGADLNQLGKAMSMYAAGGDFYVDTGAANTYVLGTIGGKQAPKVYFDGMKIRFLPANPNNGASTVNVAGLGVKAIRSDVAGTVLAPGEINIAPVDAFYNSAGGYFVLDSKYDKTLCASVYLSSDFSVTSSGDHKVPFDTVEFDDHSLWNAVDGRMVMKKPGKYAVHMNIFATTTSDVSSGARVFVNGVFAKKLGSSAYAGVGGDNVGIGSTGTVILKTTLTTDYVEAFVNSSEPTGDILVKSGLTGSFFQLEYLGA